jgi:hypothetical protein
VTKVAVSLEYGSGPVYGVLGSDIVYVGSSVTSTAAKGDLKSLHPQQMVVMTEVELVSFEQMNFDVIMGLGTDAVTDHGSSFEATSTLSNLGNGALDSFSICLGRRSGEPGRLNLGSAVPLPKGLEWEQHPVVGEGMWTVKFGGIGTKKDELGMCGSSDCVALIDSGTSLITLPTDVLNDFQTRLPKIKEDCSNMDELPTVYVELSGKVLEIPPQIYVIEFEDYQASLVNMSRAAPAGFRFAAHVAMSAAKGQVAEASQLSSSGRASCLSAFMAGDYSASSHGKGTELSLMNAPMIILGMPFLRGYASHFVRGVNGQAGHINLAGPLPLDGLCTTCDDSLAEAASDAPNVVANSLQPMVVHHGGKPVDGPVLGSIEKILLPHRGDQAREHLRQATAGEQAMMQRIEAEAKASSAALGSASQEELSKVVTAPPKRQRRRRASH